MRTKKPITIADVARKAGVSKQTVSRVINGRPDVAPDTRQRIQALIHSMGYEPDPIARSMKGRTHTIGILTPNLLDINFSAIVQAAQAEAHQQGFFTLIASAQNDFDVPPLLNEMLTRRIDGLIVINPRDDNRYRQLLPLIENGMPIVYIKNSPVNERVSAVCLDDVTGGNLATRYLTSLGHKTIAVIIGPENEECTKNRLEGFYNALSEAEIQAEQRLLVQGDWSSQSGSNAVSKLLDYKVDFTAIFAHNDRMAIGAIHCLQKAGLQIPDDVSVVGYDDLPLSAYLNPPLTTIHQPFSDFGKIGVQLLVETIHQSGKTPKIVRLEPSLTIRDSCAQPPQ